MSYTSSFDKPPSLLSDWGDDSQENNGQQGSKFKFINSNIAATVPFAGSTSASHNFDTNYTVLKTNFNIKNIKNQKIPYPQSQSENENEATSIRQIWTDNQRLLANQAIVPANFSDLATKVSKLLFYFIH